MAKKRNHRYHTFQRGEEIPNVELGMYSTYLGPPKSDSGCCFVRENPWRHTYTGVTLVQKTLGRSEGNFRRWTDVIIPKLDPTRDLGWNIVANPKMTIVLPQIVPSKHRNNETWHDIQ